MPKKKTCDICANERYVNCKDCGKALCIEHAKVGKRFSKKAVVLCEECLHAQKTKNFMLWIPTTVIVVIAAVAVWYVIYVL